MGWKFKGTAFWCQSSSELVCDWIWLLERGWRYLKSWSIIIKNRTQFTIFSATFSFCMNNTHCELSHLMHVSWGRDNKPPLFCSWVFKGPEILLCSQPAQNHNPAPQELPHTSISPKSQPSFIYRCLLCTLACNTSCCLDWACYSSYPLSYSIV